MACRRMPRHLALAVPRPGIDRCGHASFVAQPSSASKAACRHCTWLVDFRATLDGGKPPGVRNTPAHCGVCPGHTDSVDSQCARIARYPDRHRHQPDVHSPQAASAAICEGAPTMPKGIENFLSMVQNLKRNSPKNIPTYCLQMLFPVGTGFAFDHREST